MPARWHIPEMTLPRIQPVAPTWREDAFDDPAQQKEATRRRARGATPQELAQSYNVGISTIRRARRAA